MSRLDYYQSLGVARDASQEEIKRAFRRAVRDTHPDVKPDDPKASQRLQEAIVAYRVLGDANRRALHDRTEQLFGPRRHASEEVFQEKVAMWEDRRFTEWARPDTIIWRKAQARRPMVVSLVMLCLAMLTIGAGLTSDWFTRSPFQPVHQWTMPARYSAASEAEISRPRPYVTTVYLEYWLNRYRQNPSDNVGRQEAGQGFLVLARQEMKLGHGLRALEYAKSAYEMCPELPETATAVLAIRRYNAKPVGHKKPAVGPVIVEQRQQEQYSGITSHLPPRTNPRPRSGVTQSAARASRVAVLQSSTFRAKAKNMTAAATN